MKNKKFIATWSNPRKNPNNGLFPIEAPSLREAVEVFHSRHGKHAKDLEAVMTEKFFNSASQELEARKPSVPSPGPLASVEYIAVCFRTTVDSKVFDDLTKWMAQNNFRLEQAFAVGVHLGMRDARILTNPEIWKLHSEYSPLLEMFEPKATAKRPAPELVYTVLRNKGKRVPVKIGDRAVVNGDRLYVKRFEFPHKPDSEGKVTLSHVPLVGANKRFQPSNEVEYYVSVIKAEWINRNDQG